MVVTRFAPSPTGFLHLGGARTALFNWLFARHHGGRFLLRIEDTDRVRSTQGAIDTILESLRWLRVSWHGEPLYQSSRADRHRAIVDQLLKMGHAYVDEHSEMIGASGEKKGGSVVRFRAEKSGSTTFDDRVMGAITTPNKSVEDFVLLRSDGTPTYNLAVAVDDYDMCVTHVIRGSDHISNTPKQIQIYHCLGWDVPQFAHIPLILGPDGTKLSKRHGAMSTLAYRHMGYLPEALSNYLMRLGWSHGDDEIFSIEQAERWFSLEGIGRASARFDLRKLDHINGLYLRRLPRDDLASAILALAPPQAELCAEGIATLIPEVVQRAKTLVHAIDMLAFLWEKPRNCGTARPSESGIDWCRVLGLLKNCSLWQADLLEEAVSKVGVELRTLAPHLRLALTGGKVSPPLFTVMVALGREQSLLRIEDYAQTR